jgi:multidrug resistance efflux pump
VARKNHRDAVAREREAETQIDNLRAAMREARAGLKLARAGRQAAEDDLDAIDEGRRPG